MLAGINDSDEVAHQLGTLLKDHNVVRVVEVLMAFWIGACCKLFLP